MEKSFKILKRIWPKLRNLDRYLVQQPRILKYRILSRTKNVSGKGRIFQPVLFQGSGKISIGNDVNFGYHLSPQFYTGYTYIEARNPESIISIGDKCWINNSCTIVSESEGIKIGSRCLMGTNVEIYDSDFHDLHPQNRFGGKAKVASVSIGDNVFIGSNARILKGVSIGDNSVIANSSVVVSSIPSNVIAAGNPARAIKSTLSVL